MIAWIKFGGIIALALAIFFAGYHVGGMAPKLAQAKAEVKQAAATQAQDAKQLTVDTQAEAAHDQAIEHPPALVISQPIWLRAPAAVCPAMPIPAAATGGDTGGRAADPGPGVDLRPELVAFAQKYEAALADCRRLVAEWPK